MTVGAEGLLRLKNHVAVRRRIETDSEGRYRIRSIMPSGYACPPGSQTEKLLKAMGRQGNRPAHVHFFVGAPGYRKLTTQINIEATSTFTTILPSAPAMN